MRWPEKNGHGAWYNYHAAKRLSVPKGTIANLVAAVKHGRGPGQWSEDGPGAGE